MYCNSNCQINTIPRNDVTVAQNTDEFRICDVEIRRVRHSVAGVFLKLAPLNLKSYSATILRWQQCLPALVGMNVNVCPLFESYVMTPFGIICCRICFGGMPSGEVIKKNFLQKKNLKDLTLLL